LKVEIDQLAQPQFSFYLQGVSEARTLASGHQDFVLAFFKQKQPLKASIMRVFMPMMVLNICLQHAKRKML